MRKSTDEARESSHGKRRCQGAPSSQPALRENHKNFPGKGRLDRVSITQQVTELAKARTHLKKQLLILFFHFLFAFLKCFKSSQFENVIF